MACTCPIGRLDRKLKRTIKRGLPLISLLKLGEGERFDFTESKILPVVLMKYESIYV